jgi:hypothetical protein
MEQPREFEISMVMSRNRHDGSGPVTDQDIIGYPNRDSLPACRIGSIASGEDAALNALAGDSILLAGFGYDLSVLFNFFAMLLGR